MPDQVGEDHTEIANRDVDQKDDPARHNIDLLQHKQSLQRLNYFFNRKTTFYLNA